MSERVSIEMLSFTSQALQGNPLGDSVTRDLPVLLPPSYGASSRAYPVLWGLAGFTGKGLQMLNWDAWQPTLAQRLELLYSAGMPHAIVALPDCFTRLGGSQYVNSPATGRYEDYVVNELVPLVDHTFRTLATRNSRAVFGKSSGGYGAFMLGMKHPDVFGALASHSGDMFFEWCYKPDFPRFCDIINRAGGLESWWEAFEAKPKKSGEDMTALNILSMAACYSPEPHGFMGIGLPVELYTCKLKAEVWRRWLEHDPIILAPRYADNLRGLRLLYMDCGSRDEFNLHFGARLMSQTLTELEVPFVYEEFDDGHMSVQYRYSNSLPRLMQVLTT